MPMVSMTGCGRGKAEDGLWEITVELKSVNHRFLDLSLRLAREYAFLEETIRRRLTEALRRGHVEACVTVQAAESAERRVAVDEDMARAYLAAAARLSALGAAGALSVAELMRMDGVLTREETPGDEEALTALAAEACGQALAELTAMQAREGENLRRDLSLHLDAAAALREEMAAAAPLVTAFHREKLTARLEQAGVELPDPVRLAQELALYADRCAIDEELSRLESHIGQFRAILESPGEAGKKLDFLLQEMNREANTIGSKANDAGLAQKVVSLKSEIEKLREQVQNVM